MSVLEQIRRCRASRRTVDSTGASRATASKNARTSPVPSSSTGTRRARIRAATGDAGWPTRSRSRRQPAGSVQSTAERTPVAPSLSSVSLALRSWRDTRATAGIAGNSRTNRATAGSSSPRQAWTERTSASTRFRRAARSASRNELVWTVVKQPSPAASRRGRSGGGRTVQTGTMQEARWRGPINPRSSRAGTGPGPRARAPRRLNRRSTRRPRGTAAASRRRTRRHPPPERRARAPPGRARLRRERAARPRPRRRPRAVLFPGTYPPQRRGSFARERPATAGAPARGAFRFDRSHARRGRQRQRRRRAARVRPPLRLTDAAGPRRVRGVRPGGVANGDRPLPDREPRPGAGEAGAARGARGRVDPRDGRLPRHDARYADRSPVSRDRRTGDRRLPRGGGGYALARTARSVPGRGAGRCAGDAPRSLHHAAARMAAPAHASLRQCVLLGRPVPVAHVDGDGV